MNINTSVLKNDEKAIFKMRSLYQSYGFSQYKMSKFEEYDLYVRNKDFLVSDNVITFTDTDGKLMALKPDVTLSIIKNSGDSCDSVRKVYYNENVYRISKGTHSFKEIMQVGLECVGKIDDYCIYEVLMLAIESLKCISEDYVLDISHLGIVSEVMKEIGVPSSSEAHLLKCIGEKNMHEILSICEKDGVDGKPLCNLVSSYGNPYEVINELEKSENENVLKYAAQLKSITDELKAHGYGDKIHIDFSVINDMNYYNGIVFKGFIEGIFSGILSGGQYDKLLKKMGKKSGAIGFAVYLDMLERLENSENSFDVDALILYDESTCLSELNKARASVISEGKSVMLQRAVPEKIKYRQLLRISGQGVEIIENNA